MTQERDFAAARSLIEISGIPDSQIEDTFQVANALAQYLIIQRIAGGPIMPYEGRNPGIITLAAESIVLDLSREIK